MNFSTETSVIDGEVYTTYFIDDEAVSEEDYSFELTKSIEDSVEEECDCCCDCDECEDYNTFIENVTTDILETNGCPVCVMELVRTVYDIAYEKGVNDTKLDIAGQLLDEIDD